MNEPLKQLVQTLDRLKGILLLDSLGHIYLLKDYTLVEDEPVITHKLTRWWSLVWPMEADFKQEIKTYISAIQLSHLKGGIVYNHDEQPRLTKKVNEMIDDRTRYLNLQRSLKAIGAVIVTKK